MEGVVWLCGLMKQGKAEVCEDGGREGYGGQAMGVKTWDGMGMGHGEEERHMSKPGYGKLM